MCAVEGSHFIKAPIGTKLRIATAGGALSRVRHGSCGCTGVRRDPFAIVQTVDSDVILQTVMDRLGGTDGELASELVNRFGNVANTAAMSLEQLEKAKAENLRLAEENAKYADERKAVETENRNTSKKLVSSFTDLMKTLAPDFAFGGEEEDAQKLRESYEQELQNSALMRAFLSHVPVAASAATQLKRQTQASLKGVAEVERRVSEMGGSLADAPMVAPAPADDQARLLATLKKLSQF